MTDQKALREADPAPGAFPQYDIPGWRERFGVVAGITGRHQEAGQPEFDLSLHSDQAAELVMGRWRSLRDQLGDFTAVVQGHQVHGTEVRWHEPIEGWLRVDGVDGHATATPGMLLTLTVADCIPVYLVSPAQRACALLHAGWRGAADGILSRGVARLVEHGASPADIVMHCGIGICGECFQVGSDVLEAFGMRGDFPDPWAVDVRERLSEEAHGLGVGEVTVSDWCSMHHHDRFFSHRASGGAPGRMAAYLGFLDGP